MSQSLDNQWKTVTPNALKLSEEYEQVRSKTIITIAAVTTGTATTSGMTSTASTTSTIGSWGGGEVLMPVRRIGSD